MGRTIRDIEREYFSKVFTEDIRKWTKRNRTTQQAFDYRVGLRSKNSKKKNKKGLTMPDPETLKRICEELGVPVEQTYGFGDSMNDLTMIRTVGVSVCMENGAAALKEISDVVCPSVEEDGLEKAFIQLGLLNEE